MTFRIDDVLIFDVRIEAEVCSHLKKVPRKELMPVQPLGDQIFSQRSQALFDGPGIDGIAKADMSLALAPEDHTGNGGNMCLGEQNLGRITAIFADLGHPGKSIKGPLWYLAGKADV